VWEVPILLATTALRRSELLALRWSLPAFTLPVLESRRRAQRDTRLLAEMPSDELDLVCDRGDGQPIDPSTFTHAFKRLAKRPASRRRSDSTMPATVSPPRCWSTTSTPIASAVLGHASESFTMSTYQHVTPRMTERRRRPRCSTPRYVLDAALRDGLPVGEEGHR